MPIGVISDAQTLPQALLQACRVSKVAAFVWDEAYASPSTYVNPNLFVWNSDEASKMGYDNPEYWNNQVFGLVLQNFHGERSSEEIFEPTLENWHTIPHADSVFVLYMKDKAETFYSTSTDKYANQGTNQGEKEKSTKSLKIKRVHAWGKEAVRKRAQNDHKKQMAIKRQEANIVGLASPVPAMVGDGGGATLVDLELKSVNKDREENLAKGKALPGQHEYETAMKTLGTDNGDKWLNEAVTLLKRASGQGHVEATKELAFIYLLGQDNIDVDFEETTVWAKKLIDLEQGSGHTIMGMLWSYGLVHGEAMDQAKSVIHYSMASILDDDYGSMAIAYRAKTEVMISKSCAHALALYAHVAENVVGDMRETGGILSHRERISYNTSTWKTKQFVVDMTLDFYKWMADREDTKSRYTLGVMYLQGSFGVERHLPTALSYLELAAADGHMRSMSTVGNMYLYGKGVKVDYKKALSYFKTSARKGDAMGEAGLGYMCLHGLGIGQSFPDALTWFKRASTQGSSEGSYQLGVMYFNGLGTDVQHDKALRAFQSAAEDGHTLALYSIGLMYSRGISVPKSCNFASYFFKAVAERGRWSKWLDKAYRHYQAGDMKKALAHYLYAAESGCEIAQNNAAWIIHHYSDLIRFPGWNQNTTNMVAFELWRRAAEQDNVHARVRVGDYFFDGVGVKKNRELAMQQYRIAGAMGSTEAFFNLGTMYESGEGGTQDFHLARRNYDRALELDPKVQIPVTFALAKLSVKEFAQAITLSDHLTLTASELNAVTMEHGDIVVIIVLAFLLRFLVRLRRHLYGI
eukprot:CFRG4788T1